MSSRISSTLFLLLLLSAINAKAEAKKSTPEGTDINILNTEAEHLLEEVQSLRGEVLRLQTKVDQMTQELEETKAKLKKVSIASTQARHYRKSIQRLEKDLSLESPPLSEKRRELQEKELMLQTLQAKISWIQDEVSGPLLKTVSENFLPPSTENPILGSQDLEEVFPIP